MGKKGRSVSKPRSRPERPNKQSIFVNGELVQASMASPAPMANNHESITSTSSADSPLQGSQTPNPIPSYMCSENDETLRQKDGEEPVVAPWNSVSFSCGGWLQFYLFGVARAFQAVGLDKNIQFCGTSAGALAAAGLAFEGDFDLAVDYCKKKCIPQAHDTLTGFFVLHEYVADSAEKFLLPNFRQLPKNNLQIAITQFPSLSAVRVTEHKSPMDVKHSLLCSAAAYPIAALHDHPRFGLCIDGGLSDFQPIVDDETITVSPFYFSDCDIRPSRYVPPWWAVVPPRNEDSVDWTYHLGYEDAINYMKRRKIPIPQHALTNRHSNSSSSSKEGESGSSASDGENDDDLEEGGVEGAHSAESAESTESASDRDNQIKIKNKYKNKNKNKNKKDKNASGSASGSGGKTKRSFLFDTKRRFSMHRFLGYRLGGITGNIINFFSDLGLLISFVLILKPLALLSIYFELFIKLIFAIIWNIISECTLPFLPFLLTTLNIFNGVIRNIIKKPKIIIKFENDIISLLDESKLQPNKKINDITEKFLCIFSLSLLLRFLPGSFNRPSNVYLRKHDKIYKHSFMYRVVRHVV